MQGTADKRIIRTKRSIYNAFVSLMQEQDYAAITVRALAERAEINRKTFYTYYDGLDDLVRQLEAELFEKYKPILCSVRFEADFDVYSFFGKLAAKIADDTELLRILQRCFGLADLIEQAKALLVKMYRAQTGSRATQDLPMQMFMEYAAAGFMTVFTDWIVEPAVSLEELLSVLSQIVLGGYRAIFHRTEEV